MKEFKITIWLLVIYNKVKVIFCDDKLEVFKFF